MLGELIEKFAHSKFFLQGVYHLKIPAGSKGYQKTAPYAGFLFPLRGRAEYQFNDNMYVAEVGKIIHGGANMHLKKKVLNDKPWEFITILYDVHTPSAESQLIEMDFEIEIGTNPKLEELLWKIWKTYNEPGALKAFECDALFRQILLEIFYSHQNRDRSESYTLYQKIIDYIHVHYMEHISVSEIAYLHNINENKLFYLFSKYADMGAGEYIKAYRLNRGKELLLRRNATVKDVAYQVGYNDPLYFSRLFRKQVGMTPTEFISKFRKNPLDSKDSSIL